MLVERYLESQRAKLPEPFAEGVSSTDALMRLAKTESIVLSSLDLLYAGPPVVSQYFAVEDQKYETRQRVLHLAASLAAKSKDQYLQAIVRSAQEAGLAIREVDTDALSDGGVIGKLERTWFLLGEESVMQAEGVELGVTSKALAQQLELTGRHVFYLAQKQPKRLLGMFACDQQVMPEAAEIMQRLQDLNLEITVLTGEKTRVARAVASKAGIQLIHSELEEHEKENIAQAIDAKTPTPIFICTPKSLNKLPSVQLAVLVSEQPSKALVPARISTLQELPQLIHEARALRERAQKRFFWCTL